MQVIGLQSTGEANAEAAREAYGSSSDVLISAPRIAMQQFIERQFPISAKELEGPELSTLEFQVSFCPDMHVDASFVLKHSLHKSIV